MQHVRRSAGIAVPALLLGNVALAIGPWFVRLSLSEGGVGPIGSGFWRLALALPLFIAAARLEPHNVPLLGRRGAIVAAMVSGLFFGADLCVWHVGILHTKLSNATLFGNITAILFPIYGFIAMRALPNRRQGIALGLAIIGAALLLGRSYQLSANNLMGDILCLWAGIFYTGYFIAAERARSALGTWTTLSFSVATSLPLLLAVAYIVRDPIWPHLWWPLIAMTLCSQIVGQGLMIYGVNRVSSLVMGLLLLIQPIVAAGIGWIIYGETLTPFDLLGAVAIAAALVLVRDTRRPLPAAEIGVNAAS
jgi:drug/metabolite transporter (DMT)-like permease